MKIGQRSQSRSTAAAVAAAARPVAGEIEEIARRAAAGRFVLLGEASHGTREFYEIRAAITRRLVEAHGFRVVAVEADWPDMLRVHRFVRGDAGDRGAAEALGDFERFPRWMWRNESMVAFVDWLRERNRPLAAGVAGIFGIDLYSLHRSIAGVLEYLATADPEAAVRARERYACFDQFGENPQEYGRAAEAGRAEPCEAAVVGQLVEMRRRAAANLAAGDPDEEFFARQNANVIANAEGYYRAMFRGRNASWNLRDAHMDETVRALSRHFREAGEDAKVVVWAHNSHLCDCRATEMSRRGEWNVGQLLRQRLGGAVVSIGFSPYRGTVTAADNWDEDPREMTVNPGLPGSYEETFHQADAGDFWLDLREPGPARDPLGRARLQRAIGVIYRPASERLSHYFEARLPEQFDLMIHVDETTAVRPLDRHAAPALDRPEADPDSGI